MTASADGSAGVQAPSGPALAISASPGCICLRCACLAQHPPWLPAQVDQLVFKHLVDLHFPKLGAHLEGQGVNVSSVSTNWFLCIFVNSLPLESCLRVWDIFFFHCCNSVLFRVALALVDIYSQVGLTAVPSR